MRHLAASAALDKTNAAWYNAQMGRIPAPKERQMSFGFFDHKANGRTFIITEGPNGWAVNDVTAMRNAPKHLTSRELERKFPSFWVAYAPTKQAAIEAANKAAAK
jgi:hypothetical protein